MHSIASKPRHTLCPTPKPCPRRYNSVRSNLVRALRELGSIQVNSKPVSKTISICTSLSGVHSNECYACGTHSCLRLPARIAHASVHRASGCGDWIWRDAVPQTPPRAQHVRLLVPVETQVIGWAQVTCCAPHLYGGGDSPGVRTTRAARHCFVVRALHRGSGIQRGCALRHGLVMPHPFAV